MTSAWHSLLIQLLGRPIECHIREVRPGSCAQGKESTSSSAASGEAVSNTPRVCCAICVRKRTSSDSLRSVPIAIIREVKCRPDIAKSITFVDLRDHSIAGDGHERCAFEPASFSLSQPAQRDPEALHTSRLSTTPTTAQTGSITGHSRLSNSPSRRPCSVFVTLVIPVCA